MLKTIRKLYILINSHNQLIYTYKVVISDVLFGCPIITPEHLDQLASNFDWGTRENQRRYVLKLVWDSKLSKSILIGKF